MIVSIFSYFFRCKSCSHLADDLSLIESEDLEYGEEDFEES